MMAPGSEKPKPGNPLIRTFQVKKKSIKSMSFTDKGEGS